MNAMLISSYLLQNMQGKTILIVNYLLNKVPITVTIHPLDLFFFPSNYTLPGIRCICLSNFKLFPMVHVNIILLLVF